MRNFICLLFILISGCLIAQIPTEAEHFKKDSDFLAMQKR